MLLLIGLGAFVGLALVVKAWWFLFRPCRCACGCMLGESPWGTYRRCFECSYTRRTKYCLPNFKYYP